MTAAVPITTAPMNAVSRKEVRWEGDMKLMLRHDTIGRVVRLAHPMVGVGGQHDSLGLERRRLARRSAR